MGSRAQESHLPDEVFDVFLSHNSEDKPVVRQIAEALRARKIKVWLDEWELRPGQRWIGELERALQKAKTVAVMLGSAGLGRWEQPEYEAALSESVSRKLPVIPVLLPSAPERQAVPPFLGNFTWVDFRKGLTAEELDRLEWGITGQKPNREIIRQDSFGPRLHNLPFSPLGDLLKGRDADLESLDSGQTTAITPAQAIYGLGGIGKTRLAVEYAWRSGDRYDTALFVVANSPDALRSGLANLAQPYILNLDEYKAPSEEETIAAVRRWFGSHGGWLLILDNVDTKVAQGEVTKMLPSLWRGRVLITSRIQDWAPSVHRQALETLSLDEAQKFLLERTDRTRTEDDAVLANVLAKKLEGLPLALEQAAAYISHHRQTFADYLKSWERETYDVLNWYDKNVMLYEASVAVTWQTTLRQLSLEATAILQLASYLAPDPIPLKMFENGKRFAKEGARLLGREIDEAQDGSWSIGSAIAELGSYSMIVREGSNFTVHRLVQEVMRSRIASGRQRDWIYLSLRIVNRFSPRKADDIGSWPTWDLLRPHALVVIEHASNAGVYSPTGRLMNQVALFLEAKGLYGEAEPLMRRALQFGEESLGPRHPVVALRLNNLAHLLQFVGHFSEAEAMLRRAIEIDEVAFEPQHPNVARDLNNLAQILRATSRVPEAEKMIRRALEIDETSLGADHPNVAIGLSNLAELLLFTHRLEEAEPMMERALEIDRKNFDRLHPNVAKDLNNLAQLLKIVGRLGEAESMTREALKIDEAIFGRFHPEVATDLNNLALLLTVTGRSVEAEAMIRRALEIDESTLGMQSLSVARDLKNLARILLDDSRASDAESLIRRSLRINIAVYGRAHQEVANGLHNLALFLQENERLGPAIAIMRRVVAIDENAHGLLHPKVALDLNNLALMLWESLHLSEAKKCMQRAVGIYEESLGPNHSHTQSAKLNLKKILAEITGSPS
jgi:tetratricopeptide (TPR) repeat protein